MCYGSVCSHTVRHAVQTSPEHDNTAPSPLHSLALLFMEGGLPHPSNRFDWKASSPQQPIPRQYCTQKYTHIHTHTRTLKQGFRGNCGAGGRQNDLVCGASETMVMRGRGLHQRARGWGCGGAQLVHGEEKTDKQRRSEENDLLAGLRQEYVTPPAEFSFLQLTRFKMLITSKLAV